MEHFKMSETLPIRTSHASMTKAKQLSKYLSYAGTKNSWGRDEKLKKANLLLVSTAKNYTVLLALGRKSRVA